ncbi:hypothetical protein NX059_010359 [Plenodomus lindquistii]|nr:hypothetical protein NX059_010359 [Plenodomus lindquistii]
MASRASTPQSRSRSSSASSSSSDTTMIDVPPQSLSRPARLRNSSQSHPSTTNPNTNTAPTAAHDSSFSLLLSLPRELRDRVYTAALTAPYLFSWPGKPPAKVKYDVSVNLLRANRQVYDEAVGILYSQNKLLFTHPSDLNIFRVIAAPASHNITSVYFRIREKDLGLWTSYLSSKNRERSLKADIPKLKSLWLFMRCGSTATPAIPPPLHIQAFQNTLLQTHQHLQAQNHHQHNAPFAAPQPFQPIAVNPPHPQNQNTQIPPPPPPAPAPIPFIQFAQGVLGLGGNPNPNPNPHHNHNHNPHPIPNPQIPAHPLYTSFLRFEREMGIEWLCLSLQDTLAMSTTNHIHPDGGPRPEVKIVCILRIPRREVERLVRLYPEELSVDRHGDARTRFWKVRGVEVSLEFSGFVVPGDEEGGGEG